MTYALTLPPRRRQKMRLQSALTGLIERHGRWRVIRAALFARPSQRLRPEDLGPALCRDLNIPLPPQDLSSPKQHFPW